MALSQQPEEQTPSSLLDALYCEEEKWDDETEDDEEEIEDRSEISNNNGRNSSLLPLLLLEKDLFLEDEELLSLFSKEKREQGSLKQGIFHLSLSSHRREAVEWMLKVTSHYGFCPLTSILSVNYLDRFLSNIHFQINEPWMFQLAAVTCLSLAAKVEETHVPMLLYLQVEGAKYLFKAKDIQKMELLVLSTLEWKMNPVTPLSFLDRIIRRLGLKNHLQWEFRRRCEGLLLSFLSDWRFVGYLPSVLATATMMHVIDQIESCNPLEYQNQLLDVINITKEKVDDCYKLILERSSSSSESSETGNTNLKRKPEEMTTMMNNTTSSNYNIPSSPTGVMEAYYLSCDSSNDSWAATTSNHHIIRSSSSLSSSPVTSSVSSSPVKTKKRRVEEQQPMSLQSLSFSRVFVDAAGNPR